MIYGTCPIIPGVHFFIILLIDIINSMVRKIKHLSRVKFSDKILHQAETGGTSRLAETVTFPTSLSPIFNNFIVLRILF